MGRPKGTPKTGGRKPGSVNKTTRTAREAFQLAFEGLGQGALLTWATANPTEFFKLYARLIPVEHVGDGVEGRMQRH